MQATRSGRTAGQSRSRYPQKSQSLLALQAENLTTRTEILPQRTGTSRCAGAKVTPTPTIFAALSRNNTGLRTEWDQTERPLSKQLVKPRASPSERTVRFA